MREYTAKEIKALTANPYTFKVTRHKLYFTVEFKEKFWTAYLAGVAPRKILEDLGYDLSLFRQKQIDSFVQRIKQESQSIGGFSQGEKRTRRKKDTSPPIHDIPVSRQGPVEELAYEVKYLRQEVDFLKKIMQAANTAKRKS